MLQVRIYSCWAIVIYVCKESKLVIILMNSCLPHKVAILFRLLINLLYLLYTSPLADILKHHIMCYHLYANDIQMYVSFATNDDNSLNSSITQIENCLSDINLWMTVNKLKLNKSKPDLIYLYSRHNLQTSLTSIQFGNDRIIPIEAVRNVGAIFDSTLSMAPQVNSLCKTASYHLRNIARIRHLLSKESTESYHLSIYKNSSLNTAHLASSNPLMLCYLNVILTISRPMAQERLEWQHRNYGTSFRGK